MDLTRRLGAGALVLGLAAPFAGSPFRSDRGHLDIDAAARADGGDHVSARQLAAWIRDRKPGLRVIDVRSPSAFADYAIPGAENVPIDTLGKASFAKSDTVVLYSEEGAHAARAWVLLHALGVTGAVFIPGGLADWRDEVMAPVLAADASSEARRRFETDAELSRYFGGTPRILSPGEAAAAREAHAAQTPAASLAAVRRRGC